MQIKCRQPAWKFITACLVAVQAGGMVSANERRVYEVDPFIEGTTISGQLTLGGALPKPQRLNISEPDFCGEWIEIKDVIIDPQSRGIYGVIVSIEGIESGKPFPESQTLVIENRTCAFFPQANAGVVDSVLELRNTDPVLHNTHIRRGDKFGPTVMNIVQPPGGPEIQKALRDVGFFDVRCQKHEFMQGSIHIFDHPYFVATDQTGKFELAQVPSGVYQLRIWHHKLGLTQYPLRVLDQKPVTINLELTLRP